MFLDICGQIYWEKIWLFFNFVKIIILEKTCFQNKSRFITEDQFTKHMNITIR